MQPEVRRSAQKERKKSAKERKRSELFAMRPVQFSPPRGVAENSFTKPGFGEHFVSIFPRKNSKTQSSLNFLQSGPRQFTKSDFSGIGPDPAGAEKSAKERKNGKQAGLNWNKPAGLGTPKWSKTPDLLFLVFLLGIFSLFKEFLVFYFVSPFLPNETNRKIPTPIKIKSALPPPPQTQSPPPPKRGILWTWRFCCRKSAEILGVHKIGAAISGPRIADTNFTDTRIFLSKRSRAAKRGGFKRVGFPIWTCPSFFVLFGPFLGLSRFFWDFPDLLGDGPGIFPIRPFSLSRPPKSTYEEQSRKGPRHNLRLSGPFPKKVGNPRLWKLREP